MVRAAWEKHSKWWIVTGLICTPTKDNSTTVEGDLIRKQ